MTPIKPTICATYKPRFLPTQGWPADSLRLIGMKRHVLLGALLVGACTNNVVSEDPFEARDPIRPVNEKIFAFNLVADRYVVAPVAHGYHKLPMPVRGGIDNFLTNLGEPLNALDGLAAGNPKVAFTSIWRFLLNSSFGILGFRDFAGENAGLKEQDWDFGKTLGAYGIGEGPYLVLPLLGPSTARDASGQVVDLFANPVGWYLTTPENISQTIADAVATRDDNDTIVNELYYESLDPYIAVRSTFLQHQSFVRTPEYEIDALSSKDKK